MKSACGTAEDDQGICGNGFHNYNYVTMNTMVLTRFARTPFGVFGRYRLLNGNLRFTLEPINCIPADLYLCKPSRYNAGGYDASEVQKVEGRSMIKHHIGNTRKDTNGCILHGTKLGTLNSQWGIVNSKRAFSEFMLDFGDKNFMLDIREGF